MRKLTKEILITVVVLALFSGGFVASIHFTSQTQTQYEYTVKAEQVNEDEMVDEAIDYEDLTEDEQSALFQAFKKSDHFLGGASVRIETDEKLNVLNDWRVVEVRGVPMLVAISGPEKVETTPSGPFFIGFLSMLFTILMFLFSIGQINALKNAVAESVRE